MITPTACPIYCSTSLAVIIPLMSTSSCRRQHAVARMSITARDREGKPSPRQEETLLGRIVRNVRDAVIDLEEAPEYDQKNDQDEEDGETR